uniref:Uncharacterized protein n=1 Tax=Sphaerodactylus townsendi TaxID=933632 RepID=A0ACB8F4G1_9SAUR
MKLRPEEARSPAEKPRPSRPPRLGVAVEMLRGGGVDEEALKVSDALRVERLPVGTCGQGDLQILQDLYSRVR